MNGSPGAEFAASMEGHYTTNMVSWIDYLIIGISTVVVLISLYYTIRFLLPSQRNRQPQIMLQVLDDAADER